MLFEYKTDIIFLLSPQRFRNCNSIRFWVIPTFPKKDWSVFDDDLKVNACSYNILSKITIVDPLFSLLKYLQHFAEKLTVFELQTLQDKRSDAKNSDFNKKWKIEEKIVLFLHIVFFFFGKRQESMKPVLTELVLCPYYNSSD